MEFFNLLFGGGQRSWAEAALLVCFFWVAVARPERIYSLPRFRTACILFALAMLAPVFVNLFLVGGNANQMLFGRGGGGNQDPGVLIYLQAVAPTLFVFSFLLGIDSVMPRPTPNIPRPAPPLPS